jgi:thiosulfate dehydrogenase
MRTFASFVFGVITGLLLVFIAGYSYFALGFAPAAATAQPMPFEKVLASKALHARIAREAPNSPPISADEPNLAAGAGIYRQQCAVCHGLPGQPMTAIAVGMFPHVPKLMEGKGVTDDEPGESYWKIANGIRLTGMPAFRPALSETQLWQVTLLVANADKLSRSVHDTLAAPLPSSEAGSATQPKQR